MAVPSEYGPFGEPLRVTGSMAKENPFRFSTKRANDTTDLVLYEYRVYTVSTGKWLSRDPIAEHSFAKISSASAPTKRRGPLSPEYPFLANNPIDTTDYLGLDMNIPPGTTIKMPLQGGGSSTITVGSHFTPDEEKTTYRGFCLLKKLLGPSTFSIPPFPHTYWATFTGGTASQGLTYEGSIFIDTQLKPNCSPNNALDRAITLAHEADHYYFGSNDDSKGPDVRINQPALKAYLKAVAEKKCGCCKGEWKIRSTFHQYVCDCGLKPCKPEPCD